MDSISQFEDLSLGSIIQASETRDSATQTDRISIYSSRISVATGSSERSKYNTTSDIDRERIVKSYLSNKNWLDLAFQLGVKNKTARSIIAKYESTGEIKARKRGGFRYRKLDDEMKEKLEEMLNENPSLTIKNLNLKIKSIMPHKPYVSDSTVAKALDKMLITTKQLRLVSTDRNREDVIEERYTYANWFLSEAVEKNTIFIDECGFNI